MTRFPSCSSCSPSSVLHLAIRMAFATTLALASWGGLAQTPAAPATPPVVSPFYTPGDLMRSVHRFWYAPQSAALAKASAALTPAVAAVCSAVGDAGASQLAQARTQWKATALIWDKLSSVQVGPLVLRRSSRQIDFQPTRPELIKRAIQTAPADATAMESIGSPAKGLPALEWLLWTQAVTPGTPACTYAVQVAADIQREADALARGFSDLAARKPGEDEAANLPALAELLNQWIGGVERLRWTDIEKPRMAGATAGSTTFGARSGASFSRAASGQTAARWAAQWEALRALGTSTAGTAAPGAGLASLESYMRGLGRDAPAGKFAQSMARADKALQPLSPASKPAMAAAVRALAEVKRVAEADVAPAMEVSIGFSDADGD
jgi:uncharacterized protein